MEKDNKFKITKAELQKIINEEYASMAKENKRAGEIKERLAQINEELSALPETLSEVEASGNKKVKSTGWTGAGEGDVKYGEKFEKIGSHLKEDEELEGEMEVGGEEIEGEEMKAEEAGYFEAKFAELGRELDEKMLGGESEESEEIEVEVGDNMEDEMESEESEEIEVEEIDESNHEEEAETEEEVIAEDLEEPIEGESPSQDSDARFNDDMDKDTHVNESVKGGTTVLSEGFTSERKTKLDSELDRMKSLAKINK